MPSPPTGPLPLAVPRRRIYIVPSRFGAIYGTALFFLLMGSLNYNNNAAILLALLLGMVAMASAFAAVRFLSRLSVADIRYADVFAGQAQDCQLRVQAARGAVHGDIGLRHGETRIDATSEPDGAALFAWRWAADRRGRRALGRVRLSTTYPLGLFYAWTVLEPHSESIVYPAPESPSAALPTSNDQPGRHTLSVQAEDDWHALREFQRGDSLRDIAWKVSARHDRWLVNENRHANQTPALQFSLDQVAALDRESGISRLTAWILRADQEQTPYSLRLSGRTIGPGLGADHRRRVLVALADLP